VEESARDAVFAIPTKWPSFQLSGLTNDVSGTITYPDGQAVDIIFESYYTASGNCDGIFLPPDVSRIELGTYTVGIVQGADQLHFNFSTVMTTTPTVFTFWDTGDKWLAGFVPGERVRVLAYSKKSDGSGLQLEAEQDIYVDNAGQMILTGFDPNAVIIAIGDNSGIVPDTEAIHIDELFTTAASPDCGGLPRRLIVGEQGWVIPDGQGSVKVRSAPSKSGSEIGRMPEGTIFDVLDGPTCADGWAWWHIKSDNGLEGWVSEGGDSYFVEPYP
jgi:hypothetical protein